MGIIASSGFIASGLVTVFRGIDYYHSTASHAAAEHVAVVTGGTIGTDVGTAVDGNAGVIQHVAVFSTAIHIAIHMATFDGNAGVVNDTEFLEVIRFHTSTGAEHVAAIVEGLFTSFTTTGITASVSVIHVIDTVDVVRVTDVTAADGNCGTLFSTDITLGTIVIHEGEVAAAIHIAVDGTTVNGNRSGLENATGVFAVFIDTAVLVGTNTGATAKHIAAGGPIDGVQIVATHRA